MNKIEIPEPLLEPMADVVFVVGKLRELLPRLDPVLEVFQRMNQLHARIKDLEERLRLLERDR